MRPYSRDLRERVLSAVDEHEGSLRQIARRFRVSVSFITRLLHRRHVSGSLAPRPHGGGQPPALGPEDLQRLRQRLREQPDATLAELRQRLGVACSLMAIWRALEKLKISRKKKTLHAQQRDTTKVQKQRRAFRRKIARIDPRRRVYVDETGATTAMTRTYGRAPVGERVPGAMPSFWESVTLICGLRLSGVTAPLIFPGATDTAAFSSYVEHVLVPQLRPGDVVIWDNLTPHKAATVVAAVERVGAQVIPLPPSSPDLTPIEKMYSKVKEALRSAAARTTVAIGAAIGSALDDVSLENIRGWFQSCGVCATHV
jgi:transposase